MKQERRPRQQREQVQSLNAASIAGRVARVADNLQKDQQTINTPSELCRRADMSMVAVLEVVAPVLPEIVKEQVQRLISLHDEFYQAALPSIKQPEQTALNAQEEK